MRVTKAAEIMRSIQQQLEEEQRREIPLYPFVQSDGSVIYQRDPDLTWGEYKLRQLERKWQARLETPRREEGSRVIPGFNWGDLSKGAQVMRSPLLACIDSQLGQRELQWLANEHKFNLEATLNELRSHRLIEDDPRYPGSVRIRTLSIEEYANRLQQERNSAPQSFPQMPGQTKQSKAKLNP